MINVFIECIWKIRTNTFPYVLSTCLNKNILVLLKVIYIWTKSGLHEFSCTRNAICVPLLTKGKQKTGMDEWGNDDSDILWDFLQCI